MSKQALISVSDKRGVVDFARALHQLGYRILSTGGTARLIAEAGDSGHRSRRVHGFPRNARRPCQDAEPADPRRAARAPSRCGAHAGARRSMRSIRSTSSRSTCIRSSRRSRVPIAASTTRSRTSTSAVRPCCAPPRRTTRASPRSSIRTTTRVVLTELDAAGSHRRIDPLALAKKVFAHTARYDGMIANYLTSLDAAQRPGEFPDGAEPPVGQGAADALRRESAPAGGVLPRTRCRRRAAGRIRAAAGQGALLQQHRRRRRGVGMRAQLRRMRLRHRQARESLRRCRRSGRGGGVRQGLSH